MARERNRSQLTVIAERRAGAFPITDEDLTSVTAIAAAAVTCGVAPCGHDVRDERRARAGSNTILA
jgi:hypothetical protein